YMIALIRSTLRNEFVQLFANQDDTYLAMYIANDVVSDYAQVKELLEQYYRKFARKAGNDFVSDINRANKVLSSGSMDRELTVDVFNASGLQQNHYHKNFYKQDPAVVRNEASSKLYFDGTEATVNRLIWPEVFENDIILTLPQAEALLKEAAGGRNKRQASPSPYSFWPNQTISYEFAYNDASFQNLIRSAIRHIEHNTCIRFKENGGDRDGLRYFRGNGCWSNVGRTGGRQLISIGYGCDALGIVAHETLHALGLWHEQSRDDRDQFIRVNFARIIRGTEGNFEKRTPLTSDNMGQPYDLGSVMHYGAKAFTSDWTLGSSDQREACNIQACPVTTVTKVEDKICSGRILLPCYLMERMTFGEDRQTLRDHSNRTPRNVNSIVNFSQKNAVTSKSSRDPSSSPYSICEKRFKYACPTSLLTIHLGWKGNKLPHDPPSVLRDSSGECCNGYYLSNDKVCKHGAANKTNHCAA
ncbi:astacin, partial [Teladorsagia circumcincta]